MKELLAYHNKESLKEKYVKRMQEHIKADVTEVPTRSGIIRMCNLCKSQEEARLA